MPDPFSTASEAVGRIAARYETGFKALVERVLQQLETLVRETGTGFRARAQLTALSVDDLASQLNAAGWGDLMDSLTEDYAGALTAARGTLGPVQMVLGEEGFYRASTVALEKALGTTLPEFQRLGLDLAGKLKGELEALSLGAATTVEDAVARIQPIMVGVDGKTGTLSQARTLVETGLSSVQRRLHDEAEVEIGEPMWRVYRGSAPDKIIRRFCAKLVGKAISPEQFGELRPESGLPVSTGAGGWNCRHIFTVVPESYVEEEGLEKLTAEQLKAANTRPQRRWWKDRTP